MRSATRRQPKRWARDRPRNPRSAQTLFDALTKTLAANVGGLSNGPLVPAIVSQATSLRAGRADLVIVVSHPGGRCERFDDPADLSSCDGTAEIFDVARRLPAGLVDVIVAGHTHGSVAHTVAGVPIVQAGSWGHAFGRVDVTIDDSLHLAGWSGRRC